MLDLMEYNVCNKRLGTLTMHPRYRDARSSRRSSLKPEITNTFGICFDVDGVLLRGSDPIPSAKKAFLRLGCTPVVFLTNSCGSDAAKALKIAEAIEVDVKPEQVIQAQSPLKLFTSLHSKFCLIIGQGDIKAIAKSVGFKDTCSLEDVSKAYPLLDMVDHDNRNRIASDGFVETGMRCIEAIVLMGEPKRWESALQLVVDILRTDGRPTEGDESIADVDAASYGGESTAGVEDSRGEYVAHIPVFACNADLQFQDRARIPRYGHGAFLCCLEALYHKITGCQLHYQQLIGKPSELSFRYAEHVLNERSRLMNGSNSRLTRMYMIGDTPQADIVGANLYQRYIERELIRKQDYLGYRRGSLPSCRVIPQYANLSKQTVTMVESILVCTGVYKPDTILDNMESDSSHHHRDFAYTRQRSAELETPTIIVDNVEDAINYILEKEDKE